MGVGSPLQRRDILDVAAGAGAQLCLCPKGPWNVHLKNQKKPREKAFTNSYQLLVS